MPKSIPKAPSASRKAAAAAFLADRVQGGGYHRLKPRVGGLYHTIHDTYTDLDPKCLSDRIAVAVTCLGHIDAEWGDGQEAQSVLLSDLGRQAAAEALQ